MAPARASGAAVAGPMKAGLAALPFDCASSPNVVTTTSAFASPSLGPRSSIRLSLLWQNRRSNPRTVSTLHHVPPHPLQSHQKLCYGSGRFCYASCYTFRPPFPPITTRFVTLLRLLRGGGGMPFSQLQTPN